MGNDRFFVQPNNVKYYAKVVVPLLKKWKTKVNKVGKDLYQI